jgi:hypothetical protein
VSDPEGLEVRPSPTRGVGWVEGPEGHPRVRARSNKYVSASSGFTDIDVEWKRLLRERLGVHNEAYKDAKAFWTDLCNLRQCPNLDEKGQEALERLS